MKFTWFLKGFKWFLAFIGLFLFYELTSVHLTVSNLLGYKAHTREDVYVHQREDFFRVIEICARGRLKHFRKACERLPYSRRKSIRLDELQSVRGFIHDQHKIIIEAFPKSGSTEMKMKLYNNTDEEFLPTKDLTSAQLQPEQHGFHSFADEDSAREIERKLAKYKVIMSVLHPLKRLEAEYEGLLTDSKKEMTFTSFLDNVIKGKYAEEALRPYIDFCATIDDIDYLARTETARLDVPFLSSKYLPKEIDPMLFQTSAYNSSPHFQIALPLFSSLDDPAGYIAKLSDYEQDMEMLMYTYDIDPTGGVIGSCKITSHGVCC